MRDARWGNDPVPCRRTQITDHIVTTLSCLPFFLRSQHAYEIGQVDECWQWELESAILYVLPALTLLRC